MPAATLTPNPDAQQRVFDRLNAPVKNRDDLLRLFVTDLGFERIEQPIPPRQETFGTGQALDLAKNCPTLLRLAGHDKFQILYAELDGKRLDYTRQRILATKLLETFPDALVIFARKDTLDRPEGAEMHIVNVKGDSGSRRVFRRFKLGPGERYRTASERLALLDISDTPHLSLLDLRHRLDAAFDVEAVTQKFFQAYKQIFDELQRRLYKTSRDKYKTSRDKAWAHDYALQFLNRLMFLYFIQRKRWLGNDPHFLRTLWEAYKRSDQRGDTFFDRWLSVLFFEAFNNKFQAGRHDRQHLPPEIRSALARAPYLNGGLFTENRLDDAHNPQLTDDFFALLFDQFDGTEPGFLERYNFTIAESTPLDVEVAVDPEMIGKVYESLVNITSEGLTEEDLRGTAGIFYTPRVEIDLMCRLSLVDALANRIGTDHKPLLYDAIFAYDPADKEAADRALAERNLWPTLSQHLRTLSVCDPACGSGSFLVGMLLVLDDLQARANTQLGLDETPYQRRRRIIGEQLYGVDVMDWAVHVAELRLWLQLVVETELEPAELHLRPLLPNLSFKVRQGDSLVQEIGGINFGLHRHHLDIPAHLKGRITQLKGKKLRFYQGETGLREADLKQEELNLFRDILDHKRIALQKEIATLTRQIESPPEEQTEMAGIATGTAKQERLKLEAQWRAECEEKQADLQRLKQAVDALRAAPAVPFVWDIAFVEIFEGDAGGFDIVIGNPPYVRQEMIAPPLLDPGDFGGENSARWKEQKKAYKEKLQQSVAAAWPRFFRYNPRSLNFRKLDGKSDLYIYFYLHGLALLNPRGSFCFITSNSWLDVGYGADLQEFLLKHSHVKLILDNEKKRSFAQADVNTIIALLAPPDDRRETGLDQTARFVMFKAPFEDILRADVFKQIETATERRATDQWRICVCPQRQLLEEGLQPDETDEDADQPKATAKKPRGPLIKTARYIGNKWGGKYLRAPDIFFTILEKGKGKLVRLGDIAEVRRGFTTGANEFFYLEPTGKPASKGCLHVRNAAGWEGEIEEEFLKPFLFSLKEVERYEVDALNLERKVLVCSHAKEDLRRKGTKGVLSYIEYGERQGFNTRPSVRGRRLWYALPEQHPPDFVSNRFLGERLGFPFLRDVRVCDVFFVGAFTNVDRLIGTALLNSIVSLLSAEVTSRKTYGIGVAYLYGPEIRGLTVINPAVVSLEDKQRLDEAFSSMRKRAILRILDEIHQPDRRALDEVVFEVLGLTAGERGAVYEAVVALVRARLEKAQSV